MSGLDNRSGKAAERRRVFATIVFVDVVGSTDELQRLEREAGRDALEQSHEALALTIDRICQSVREYQGVIPRVQGDGVMALFSEPLENHAFHACCAALKIRDAFRSLAREAPSPRFAQIRIGIHSGLVLVEPSRTGTASDFDIHGLAANQAKRAEDACAPNAAIMSGVTRDLAGPAVRTRPDATGEFHELLSIDFHQDLSDQFAGIRETPLVGRQDVLAALRAKLSAEPCAVAIVGNAGIGKSRLLYELSRIAVADGFRLEQLRGHEVHRLTPFAPWRPFVARLLERGYARAAQEAEEMVALLAPPASDSAADGAARRRELTAGLARLLAAAAAEAPLLLIAEDVHEFDAESLDLLTQVRRLAPAARISLVVSARPTGREAARALAGELVDLDPLTDAQSAELAQALRGDADIAPEAMERAIVQASGTPLFLEASMSELRSGRNGDATPAKAASLVQARMSSLSAGAKEVMRAAATLRADFDRRMLGRMTGMPEEALERYLAELAQSGLIEVSEAGAVRFTHDLYCTAADDLLLRDQRSELHRRAADALESLTPERAERLAHHCELAGAIDRALDHLLRAIRSAVRTSALKTVRAHYARATVLRGRASPAAERTSVAIAAASFDALQQSGDGAAYNSALDDVIETAGRLGDRENEALAHCHKALICWMFARHDEGRRHAETALAIARDIGSARLREMAQSNLANVEHARGNVDRAIALQREVVDMLSGDDEKSMHGRMIVPSVRARAFLAWFLIARGGYAEAGKELDRADAILEEIDQPYSRVLVDAVRGLLETNAGRPEDAVAPLVRARERCLALQYHVMEPCASAWLASALVQIGKPDEALAIARHSIEKKIYLAGGRYTWVYIHQALAEAQFAMDQMPAALETIEAALSIAEESREPIQIATARFVRGRILVRTDKRGEGERDLGAALEIAERHGLDPLAADCRRELTRDAAE